MYEDDPFEVQVKAEKRKTPDRRVMILAICLCVALLLAVGLGAGFAGYALGKNNVTVLRSEGGNPVQNLSTTTTRSIADVVDEVADSVVEINCKITVRVPNGFWGGYVTREATSAGSGVILAQDGTIITNHHVIADATSVTVRLRNGHEYAASLIGSDESNDIGIIRIAADEELTCATFGDSSALKVGQPVVVIGNPLGTLGGTVTDGIISALDRDITVEGTTMRLLQTNASINSGNSGGGMFDLSGRLIGIVNAKSTGDDVEGLGFAIPADTALQVATEILSK